MPSRDRRDPRRTEAEPADVQPEEPPAEGEVDEPTELPERDAMSILTPGFGDDYVAPLPGYRYDVEK